MDIEQMSNEFLVGSFVQKKWLNEGLKNIKSTFKSSGAIMINVLLTLDGWKKLYLK